jgi:hypothetical protein
MPLAQVAGQLGRSPLGRKKQRSHEGKLNYTIAFILAITLVSCSQNNEYGEGVTRKVVTDHYGNIKGIRKEIYSKDNMPFKALGYYEDGKLFYQSYYVPIDSLMLMTTIAYYPSGSLQSINQKIIRLDTIVGRMDDGKESIKINIDRNYSINGFELYPNWRIKRWFGRNNTDTVRTYENWYESGKKQNEYIYKYSTNTIIKSLEWDSLGNLIQNGHTSFK